MLRPNPILLSAIALLIASLACAAPSVTTIPSPDASLLGTMVAQTVAAVSTQTAEAFMSMATPTSVFTLEPTLTPTVTLSPTPVFTPSPSVPLITVSVATNCRVGPGRAYDRVGALLVGEVAEVFGVSPNGTYWYIRNPDQTNGFCWLWGEYATLAGNIVALPVFTPPPTPTPVPAFTAGYAGLEVCSTSWWVDIRLENTGGVTFRSISITLRDLDTGTVLSMSENGFTNYNGCTDSNTRDTLEPSGKRAVSTPAFNYDPTGHQLRVTITLCSNRDHSGLCTSEVINFKP